MRATFEALPLDQQTSFRFSEIDQGQGFDGHWHYHPELELKWVLDGVGQRMVGDHMQSFGPSDLVLVGSNLSHCWRTAPDFSGRSRAFLVQFPQDLVSQGPELAGIQKMLDDSQRGLSFHLGGNSVQDRLSKKFKQLEIAELGSWESYSIWLSLLGELSEMPREYLASAGYNPKEPEDERLARVIDFIFESVEGSVDTTVFPAACNIASMTPSAFSRFFKRHTGRTFSRFFNEAKVARASRLLVESAETVLSISLECGFGSLSHFNRTFEEIKGSSPGRWRKQFRAS